MDIFQIAGIGMLDGRQRLEAVSQNAASMSLPGFRRQVVTGSAFDSILLSSSAQTNGTGLLPAPARVNVLPGATKITDRSLDVAIDAGDAYFALTDGTHTWLTRSGAFRLDPSGTLVGEGGFRVIGAQGDIHLADSNVEIGADGRILRQGEPVGAIALFRATNPSSLRAATGSLLSASDGIQPAEAAHVRDGMLEGANTDPTREMISAVGVSRQFEALSRVVQAYDDMLGRSIEKLAEV